MLRARARQAIPELLSVITMRNERRGARSERSADFRELAVWFAQAPTDADMHDAEVARLVEGRADHRGRDPPGV